MNSGNVITEIEIDEFFTSAIIQQPTLLPLLSTKVAVTFPNPGDDHVEKRLDFS
ncbi:MAG TPA: hypothetical protein VK141_07420 [Nitrosomonas sp.]|nr:hypothetical protein [Nitrosomonas sp.]